MEKQRKKKLRNYRRATQLFGGSAELDLLGSKVPVRYIGLSRSLYVTHHIYGSSVEFQRIPNGLSDESYFGTHAELLTNIIDWHKRITDHTTYFLVILQLCDPPFPQLVIREIGMK